MFYYKTLIKRVNIAMNKSVSTLVMIFVWGLGFIGAELTVAQSPSAKEFNQFSSQAKADYQHFSQKNEKIFATNLLKDWKSFKRALVKKNPQIIKPKQQPILKTELGPNVQYKRNDKHTVVNKTALLEQPSRGFYGHKIPELLANSAINEYRGNSPVGISEYRNYLLANKQFTTLISVFKSSKKKITHDHWANALLANYLCGRELKQESSITLCTWAVLHSIQLDARLAQAETGLLLLLASKQGWLERPYYQIEGISLYVFNHKKYKQLSNQEISLHLNAYPNAVNQVNIKPSLGLKPAIQRIIKQPMKGMNAVLELDLDHIKYTQHLPILPITAYLHDKMPNYLATQIVPLFPKEKTTNGVIENILSWVQELPYQTDDMQFGLEKPMTFSQLLYFNASDCEDRVYAFATLLASMNIFNVAALQYPNHLSAAVKINRQWYETDPTYKGGKVGQSQPAFKEVNPIWHY